MTGDCQTIQQCLICSPARSIWTTLFFEWIKSFISLEVLKKYIIWVFFSQWNGYKTSHLYLHHSIHQTVVWSTPWWYKPAKHWCWKTFSCKNLWMKLKPVFVAFGLLIVLFALSSWLFCSDPDAAWPRGLSACLCLSHTVIDVQIQRLSKNVPHQRLSAVWAGYSSSPPLLLIYWWCLQNVAPLHVVEFPFLALFWRDAAVCWKSCCMRQAEEGKRGK